MNEVRGKINSAVVLVSGEPLEGDDWLERVAILSRERIGVTAATGYSCANEILKEINKRAVEEFINERVIFLMSNFLP